MAYLKANETGKCIKVGVKVWFRLGLVSRFEFGVWVKPMFVRKGLEVASLVFISP